jgi:hypothetical protein
MKGSITPVVWGTLIFFICVGIKALYKNFNKKIAEEEIEENE